MAGGTVIEIEGRSLMSFTSAEVLKRVARLGDLFAPVLALKQKLPASADLKAVIDGL
ncbi:MAG TPA: hypothetical protein VHM91_09860 [Verrucomicrobiales bacterium]|jgi:bifunctional non-homologous end joining protein LigD|nr:hypothetical protein [Verrucomicrobiales bacterium]